MRHLYLLLVILCVTSIRVVAQDCPPWGDADNPRDSMLNVAKNKTVKVPKREKLQKISLKLFINSKTKEDSNAFFRGAYIETSGYLVSHEEQGEESCNCKEAKKKKKDGDVHIYLGLVPDAEKQDCIVIEITPEYKLVHPEYETQLTDGKKVKVRGYLFYDEHHRGNAVNTCKSCKQLWRRTCWEIHPVTDIKAMR